LGFALPLAAVPILGWAVLLWAGALLVPLGLVRAQEVPAWRGMALGAMGAAAVVAVAVFS
jgi:hypothetical protein